MMFDKWKRSGSDHLTTLPSPPLSSSSSSPCSSSSSLPEDVNAHPKRYIMFLKKWFTPRSIQKSDPGMCYSTPDPRRRSRYHPEYHLRHYHEQSYIQQHQYQYQYQSQQNNRWSVDVIQEYLSSPPPRRFTLKFPPPTCGGAFLSTIPEL